NDQFLKSSTNELLLWPQSTDQEQRSLRTVLAAAQGTTLIIVPTIERTAAVCALLPDRSNTAVLHSQLSKSEFYRTYHQILRGESRYVIGTKLALFAPLKKISTILIDRAEDGNHKQSDQNPRYDTRTVAATLAKLHHARLVYSTYAPTVGMYDRLRTGRLRQLTLPPISRPAPKIVDMQQERLSGNYRTISAALSDSIDRALASGRSAVILINRRGSATSVQCHDCGHTLRCPTCALPLAWHERDRTLYCHRCSKRNTLPATCPQCHGTQLMFRGSGTELVERELRKRWPQVPTVRLDRDTGETTIPNHGLAVGTEVILSADGWEHVGAVGAVAIDFFLNLPDYSAAERTWQMLTAIQFHTAAPLTIQTYNASHPAVRALAYQKPELFYDTELADRATVGYPPSAGLIKLAYLNRDKQACLIEAKKLLRILRSSPLPATLVTPLTPYQHGAWRMYIVLKYNLSTQSELVGHIMATVPDAWTIDRDPISLL
ncbi:MAG: primosomal protein N', partial [Patescibacteria group bacterium]